MRCSHHGDVGQEGPEAAQELDVYDTAPSAGLIDQRDHRSFAIDFIRRQVRKPDRPFFALPPLHPDPRCRSIPTLTTREGPGTASFADVLAQTDAYVGRLLDEVDRLGIRDNTIFIFTSDNGPDPTVPHQSFAGPWSGSYFTGREGSLRVPFILRWPGKVPAGAVSNEIVHEMDLFPSLARIAGGQVPGDRVIDGVDQVDFFLGEQESSNREHVVVYVGNELYGIKWRNYKMMNKEIDRAFADPTRSYGVPLIYDLHTDPKEENPLNSKWYHNGWIRWPAGEHLVRHLASFREEPPIRPGTPDPYVPGGP